MTPHTTSQRLTWREPVALGQMHVMIFDDDFASRGALRLALKTAGVMFIHEANSGHTVSGIDVVISALRLQASTGLRLLKAIRTGLIKSIKPDVCFLFVSESVDPAVLAAAAQLDANGYLLKPVPATRLRDAIVRGRGKCATLDKTKYAAADAGCLH